MGDLLCISQVDFSLLGPVLSLKQRFPQQSFRCGECCVGTEQILQKWMLLLALWDGHTGPVSAPTMTSSGLSIPGDLLLEVLHVVFV